MIVNRDPAIDVVGESSVIKIDLIEPFSKARIFDVPVLGEDCLHHDAFDLEIFLDTRPRPSTRNRLTRNDWHCPICSSECTPEKLVKDGLFVEVRDHLEATGRLEIRSIIVDGTGNWQRIAENAIHAVVLDVVL